MNSLWSSFLYIQSADYFWASMGFTTAVAMFVGALIYDGDTKNYKKGVATVLSYVIVLLWVNISRVSPQLSGLSNERLAMALAGIVTIVSVTLAWLFGLFLGVTIFKRSSKLPY